MSSIVHDDVNGGWIVPKEMVEALMEPNFNSRRWPEISINLTTGERSLTGRTWSLVDGMRDADGNLVPVPERTQVVPI